MQILLLECHLEGGMSMECKIKKTTGIIIILVIFFSITVYLLIGYYNYKKLLFYNYSYDNTEAINLELKKLGFKYTKNFAECPEKRILMSNIQIQYFSYNDRNCIIIFCNSKSSKYIMLKILNKMMDNNIEKGNLPDDFYHTELFDIMKWKFRDRKISFIDFGNVSKFYIEKE